MIDIRQLIPEDHGHLYEAWNNYVADQPVCSVYHMVEWKEIICKACYLRPYYFYAVDGSDRICGVLPLFRSKSFLFGTYLTSIPFFNYGGVAADSQEIAGLLFKAGIEAARECNAEYMELRHKETFLLDNVPSKTHKVRMVLDLPDTPDILWDSFKSKLRSQIKRASRENMSVRIGGMDLLTDFYRVFSANMRDLGTPVWPKKLFYHILDQLSDLAFICVVYYKKTPVATGFLLGFGDTMEIPFASSLRKYNTLSPNMLLYWNVLEFSCSKKFKKFDFGRSSPDAGTYRFKEQWGAVPQTLHWQYWLPRGSAMPEINPQNPKYQLAISAWRKLPVVVANTIGPHIARNLP
ncbi:MAG: FemAB family PEP-CTERM system-associated protein [Candidatus Auribacterota bacterium]|nr:FemAB family PEP-CTERM system-associated protein [Candidatus Auribacterota bacterium]